MNCSTPGLLVLHQLPESTQTHVHWVSDAIQPSHPLLSPSPALNLSFPFLCGQFLELWQLKSWVQSGHRVVNFSTWAFSIYKIEPLQDMAQNIIYNPWERFPGGSDCKEYACNAGDLGSIPGLGWFLLRRSWQPTPVFLPGKSHGWRSLAGYSPWGHKEPWLSDFTWERTKGPWPCLVTALLLLSPLTFFLCFSIFHFSD